MNVTPTTSQPAAPAPAAGLASAGEQQDRFMKLLVAQMKNQDPLNPMDNAQMTTQIAQINTVAGLERLNTTVEGLASQFTQLRELMDQRLPSTQPAPNPTPTSTPSNDRSAP